MNRPRNTPSARLRALASRLESLRLEGARASELEALLARIEGLLPGGEANPAPPAFPGAAPIRIWCDGSCSPNPGPGGWGAIVQEGGAVEELSGASPQSTNNIMEMTAAIAALERTPEGAAVHVTTDSRYLMDGITRWLQGWKRRGWRKADGDPVLNRELWQKLDALQSKRSLTWAWVRGHSGHPENDRCDELANEARRALSSASARQ